MESRRASSSSHTGGQRPSGKCCVAGGGDAGRAHKQQYPFEEQYGGDRRERRRWLAGERPGSLLLLLRLLVVMMVMMAEAHPLAPAAADGDSAKGATITHGREEHAAETTRARIKDLMEVGLSHYREGRYGDAVGFITGAVDLRPQDPDLRAYQANALFRAGYIEPAIATFKQAIALDDRGDGTRRSRYWSNLGSVYFFVKRYEEAAECYSQAQALEPEDGTFQKNMDTANLYLRVESLQSELEGRGGAEGWNLSMALRGYNYSHQLEVAYSLAMKQRPDLLEGAVQRLRTAVRGERAEGHIFATADHMLANSLVQIHDAILLSSSSSNGAAAEEQELVEEARELLKSSILAKSTKSCGEQQKEGDGAWTYRRTDTSTKGLHVVTVATSPRHELTNLKLSCEQALGVELVVLGMNSTWQGLGSKIRMLTDYLASSCRPSTSGGGGGGGCRDEDVLLFVDAYDVLLLPTARHLLMPRFLDLDAPIVMSGETGCAPDASARLLYPHTHQQPQRPALPYLNSGSYMGYVGAIKAMLADIAADIHEHHSLHGASPTQLDDQRWFTRHYLRQQLLVEEQGGSSRSRGHSVRLDSRGVLFHTLHHVDPSQLHITSHGQAVNLTSSFTNGTTPCLVHGNGDGLGPFHEVTARLQHRGWPSNAVAATTTSKLYKDEGEGGKGNNKKRSSGGRKRKGEGQTQHRAEKQQERNRGPERKPPPHFAGRRSGEAAVVV